jgi:hypothetical protein
MATTWAWIPIFAIAIAMRHWPRFAGKLAAGIPFLTLLGVLALLQFPLKIAGMVLQLQVAAGWGETIESLFLLDNWHLLYGAALLVGLAGWRYLISPPWLTRTWVICMGLGLEFAWGALSLPGIWYGGLRDFSFAALQFAPLLVLWIALAARAVARPVHDHEPGVAQDFAA